jgi:hypothetical protein
MKHVCDVYVAFAASAAFTTLSSYDHATLVHDFSLLDVVDAFDAFNNASIIEYANDATSPCTYLLLLMFF